MSLQKTMKALADPTRRDILKMLRIRRMSAGEIETSFNMSFAAISRHLSVLKDADLVIDTREGKYVYYELNASVFEDVIIWLKDLMGDEKNEDK